MAKKLILLAVIFSAVTLQVTSRDCEEYRNNALQLCRGHYGKSLNICMHRRMKRSQCNSDNNHCGECNCNYCSSNACSSRCDSCCNPKVYEEEEVCETSYCCHRMCHRRCYTPNCRRSCRQSCVKSIDTKQQVVNKPQGTNITTVINLHNKVNNTNIIDMPVKINTTNVNNLELPVPEGVRIDTGETEPQKGNSCCELMVELCDPVDKSKCYREKQRYCGKECSANDHKLPQTNQRPPPSYYPVQNKIPQVPPQQYYPFQQYPLMPSNVLGNYPTNYPKYTQNFQQTPLYSPYVAGQVKPQGCKEGSTYPYSPCNDNLWQNQWQNLLNQPRGLGINAANIPAGQNNLNGQNFFSPQTFPSFSNPSSSLSFPAYNMPGFQIPSYYGSGQDLTRQPVVPQVQTEIPINPDNTNKGFDENGIDDNEDDEDEDGDDI